MVGFGGLNISAVAGRPWQWIKKSEPSIRFQLTVCLETYTDSTTMQKSVKRIFIYQFNLLVQSNRKNQSTRGKTIRSEQNRNDLNVLKLQWVFHAIGNP